MERKSNPDPSCWDTSYFIYICDLWFLPSRFKCSPFLIVYVRISARTRINASRRAVVMKKKKKRKKGERKKGTPRKQRRNGTKPIFPRESIIPSQTSRRYVHAHVRVIECNMIYLQETFIEDTNIEGNTVARYHSRFSGETFRAWLYWAAVKN